MNNNNFVLYDDELDNLIIKLNKNNSESSLVESNIPTNFQNLNNTGLFSDGIKKIGNQFNELNRTMNNVKNKLVEHKERIFLSEYAFDKRAQEIEIPQDFVKNDSTKVNTIDDIYLSKNDGKSVNTGEKIDETNELNDYDLNKKELESIVANNEIKEEKYDSSSSLSQEKIDNINNGKDTKEVNIDEESTIESGKLETVNNYNDLQGVEYDDNIDLESVSVGNIKNDNVEDDEEIKLEDIMNYNDEMEVLDNDNKS